MNELFSSLHSRGRPVRIMSSFSCSISWTILPILFISLLDDHCVSCAAASPERYSEESDNSYYSYNSHQAENVAGAMGEYVSDWNNQEWAKMSGRMQEPKCIDIPSNLTLCQDIGYQQMMLPNLLEHDSLNEVTSQAASWIPLIRINCHPDTRIFLCSLFSPVCLERLRPILPCRSLCQGVQASCVGRMKTYGFDWPEMLKCDKFPVDNDMCIRLVRDAKPDNNCTACKHPLTHENLIDHYCRADVVMRVSIKDVEIVNGSKQLHLKKKKKFFKNEGEQKKESRGDDTAIIEGGASCQCDSINSTQERYLLMANRRDGKLIITFGMAWSKKDKEFKKGIRAIRKGNTCEGIIKELQINGIESKPASSSSSSGTAPDPDHQASSQKKKKKKQKKKPGKGKKGKKDKKGKKKKVKNKGKKDEKTAGSKSEAEDVALRNFKKAAN